MSVERGIYVLHRFSAGFICHYRKFGHRLLKMEFDTFYSSIFGDRWPGLKAALLAPETKKVLLKNPFAGLADYSLDEASLFPASVVKIKPGFRVADFCSAPGGKLLSLLFQAVSDGVDLNQLEIFANDLSPDRIRRLKAVLHDCLPADLVPRIQVKRGDAGLIGLRYPQTFDLVVVDAPCSGERHLLHSPKELSRWTAKSGKRLAIRQHALACSGLDALTSGGVLIYSTCSLSPVENDGVIERLLESRENQFKVRKLETGGEATQHGRIFLPDLGGAGPLFCSILDKI